MAKKIYKDDSYEAIVNDLEKIQMKPGMYIGPIGTVGALHLAKEAINNMIDECINPKSPGKIIDIILNNKTREMIVKDDGRGIPFDILVNICTILNSSSKFYREGSGGSAGENGCGIKATNALSDLFGVLSERYDGTGRVEFKQGKITKPLKVVKNETGRTGTTFTFIPSELFLGKGARIIDDELVDWIEKIIHLCPDKIMINLEILNEKGKTKMKKTYQSKNGIIDYLDVLSADKTKRVSKPTKLFNKMETTEIVLNRRKNEKGDLGQELEMERFLGIEVAYVFADQLEYKAESFCNFVHNTGGGVHHDACRMALVDFFREKTKDTINKKDSKDLSIMSKDVEIAINMVVNLTTNINPQFTGQRKDTVGNGDFMSIIRKLVKDALVKHYEDKPNELKTICTLIKVNAKSRLEGQKARIKVKKETGMRSFTANKNLEPANNTGKGKYKELYIVEGESAATVRYNNYTQALFKLRGYYKNTFNKSIAEIIQNEEVKNMISALGCGIGKDFNIDNLEYDKIIIMTDSDSDGYAIRTLVIAFFLYHMPGIIEAGKLFVCVAPLYKLKNASKVFVRSKREYIEEFESNIANNIKISPIDGKVLNRSQMKDFLYTNREYLDTLQKISSHFSVHEDIMEYIAHLINIKCKSINKEIKKVFKELSIDKNVLCGIYKDHYQILVIDDLFIRHIEPLLKLMRVNKKGININVVEKNKSSNIMTIGQMMSICEKYKPQIITRYKGLGELSPSDLKDTTLDPSKRLLYRLTTSDIQKELERYDILHGRNLEARKEKFTNIDIERDLLDN